MLLARAPTGAMLSPIRQPEGVYVEPFISAEENGSHTSECPCLRKRLFAAVARFDRFQAADSCQCT